MSVVGVGIDLVEIEDVERSISAFGDRYLSRIYTDEERAYADSAEGQRAARFAARFAAKEAVIKLLRPRNEAISWRDIEICRTAYGACEVRLGGSAADLAAAAGIDRVSVSLTHHGGHAAAVAAALYRCPDDTP